MAKKKAVAKIKSPMTDKVKRFIEEYCRDFNATQAAIRSGYSENSAAVIGFENLRKPKIREEINKRIKDLSLGSEETLKAISDIARSSLNDYFTIKEVWRTPKVEKALQALIIELQEQIEDADKFIVRAKIEDPKELEAHTKEQERRRQEIIRLEIELERNPSATRVVNGEPELTRVADLDLARLIEDKEAGRIKAVKRTEFGTNVEMYAADTALTNLARIHGLFEKDNEQGKAAPVLLIQTKIIPSEVKIATSEKEIDV